MFTESIEFVKLEDVIDSILQLAPENTLILCDYNTNIHCLSLLAQPKEKLALSKYKTCIIPAGEEYKNLTICEKVWGSLLENKIDRNGTLVNLGGGVVTDLGAFCASVYKRGISFINIPTSYMAMVDAAIGGKTGIGFGEIKNTIGSFADPEEVIICKEFLHTLPEIELINGYAETIKHALIASPSLWEKIKAGVALGAENIEESLSIKTTIVENDPFEMGERKLLNFGHTIGHAIEGYFVEKKRDIRHGEAIAIGMYCEAFISYKENHLTMEEVEEIGGVLRKYYPKKEIKILDLSPIIEKTKNDKKNNSQGNNFSLLAKIGSGLFDQYIETPIILESLENYRESY